ncbi:TetR/AcrR family transcriptional regulator [Nocardia heshunensis]
MGRWEPDGRQRLVRAALDLFGEQGYDNTTVIEIAERAGLTKSTFFRHFPDKREVLFVGQNTLCELLTVGIAEAPETATPLEAIAFGFDSAASAFTPERRGFGPRMVAIIADHPELQERDALKRRAFAVAMTQALHARGVPDPSARLAAELGVLAFGDAHTRWLEPANRREFNELARTALHELREATAELR